jgi:hypothetical protein
MPSLVTLEALWKDLMALYILSHRLTFFLFAEEILDLIDEYEMFVTLTVQ